MDDAPFTLTSNGGPEASTGTWTIPAGAGIYVIKAVVNSAHKYDESDFENNTYTVEDALVITVETGLNEAAAIGGVVSVVNGKLSLAGYSADAAVSVYNLFGQQVTANKPLSAGIYIVKVIDNRLSTIHKVTVK
ncbi:MAG: hypothetical protein EZS26_001413 [Candidatus Ordinivivax streblomastigis]|uniref:Uncharacterized protein n=1 Tax=Candidatus Ordinivivax streblomastigis TaxID=2540710 RepID=A0A5M8P1V6_9BACT|nr:MAG: hypothetical protein EZS26_001413 [Candidatus Ordinivivax streblomastigis]